VSRALSRFILLPNLVQTGLNSGYGVAQSAGREPPDLIVTDLHMPGMGGVALIRGLKVNKSTCHIPILALTSTDTTAEEAKLAKLSGCDATYTKPINTRTLKHVISKLLKE
jgi:CheY-like chemotaxis protein